MSENTKRLLSLVMVTAMLLSFSPIRAQAQEAEPETMLQEQQQETQLQEQQPEILQQVEAELPDQIEQSETMPQLLAEAAEATPLTLDVPLDIYVSKPGETHRASFAPEVSGIYVFTSLGNYDAYGALLNAEGIILRANDDANGRNFQIVYELTAGETYYLDSDIYYTSNVFYQVQVQLSPVESIVIEPLSIPAYTEGHYSTSRIEDGTPVEYFRYNWADLIRSTVTLTDGTVVSGNGYGVTINGQYYRFTYYDNQDYYNQWSTGNTYTVPMTLLGKTANASVTITDALVSSVVIDPIFITAYSSGSMKTEPGKQYFHYDWSRSISYTVTLQDGTVITDTGSYIYIPAEGTYNFRTFDEQSADAPWLPGNTYIATVNLMGVSTAVSITINECPIASISPEPISITEYSNGYYTGSYFEYDWYKKLNYTITLTDGTKINGYYTYNDSITVNGTAFSLQYTDNQSSDAPWTVGNTYTAILKLGGKTVEVPITITETPFTDITFDPIVLKENENGYWYDSYFDYDWRDFLSYTVTLRDGSTLQGSSTSFYYQDDIFRMDYTDPQSSSNPWLVGNTYSIPVSFCGMKKNISVSVCTPVSTEGYTYLVQNGKVIITDCMQEAEILQIPDTIDGYPVVGITSLVYGLYYATELHIPDTVTMLSPDLFRGNTYDYQDLPLKKLYLGSGISGLDINQFEYASQLEEIHVSADNPYFTEVDGVLYNKDCTKLLLYPFNRTSKHKVPDSVTDIEILFSSDLYNGSNVNVEFGANIKDYTVENGIIYNKDKTVIRLCTPAATGSYTMPNTVTGIDYYAFAGSNLTHITVSNNITELVYGMFAGSKQLQSVTLPEGITTIGELAFADCTALTTVNIPASLKRIASEAFVYCNKLQQVQITDLTAWCNIEFYNSFSNPLNRGGKLYLNGAAINDLVIPETIEFLPNRTFCGGTFRTVTIPETVYSVGAYAFYNASIGTLNLEEGLGAIEYYAFANTALKSVTLPDSLSELGSAVFYGSALEQVDLGSGICAISRSCFANTKLTQVTIPSQINYIDNCAFENSPLRKVEFLGKDIKVYHEAFQNCPIEDLNLENIIYVGTQAFEGSYETILQLPDTITVVTYREFAYSPQLVCAVIPATMEFIFGFGDNHNLSHILYKGTQEQWAKLIADFPDWDDAYTVHCNATGNEVTAEMDCSTIRMHCSICDKDEIIYRYKTGHKFANGTCTVCGQSGYWDYIVDSETNTVTITAYNGKDRKLTIPSFLGGKKVTRIGDNALNDANLTELTVPNTVTYIGKNAFSSNPELRDVKLGNSVEVIGDSAFQHCNWMESISLPASLKHIGNDAFGSCYSLWNVCYEGTEEQWKALGDMDAAALQADIQYESYEPVDTLPDFTGDGQVTDADAVYLLRYTLFPEDFPLSGNGDVNGDGNITDADAVYLLRHTLFPEDFPLFS